MPFAGRFEVQSGPRIFSGRGKLIAEKADLRNEIPFLREGSIIAFLVDFLVKNTAPGKLNNANYQ